MADGHKEANFSQGWGFATFIAVLAVGAFALAGTIKSRTYLPPTDPSAPSSARQDHAPDVGEQPKSAQH